MWCDNTVGIAITGGTEGDIALGMGDGTDSVQASNVLNDYSYILISRIESTLGVLFSCATGLGPSSPDNNNEIGGIYYNNILLPGGSCGAFIFPLGEINTARSPGVYQARLCRMLTTSTEGVYTCTLTNSSMMNQSMSIGVYLGGRSKLICI